MTFRRMAFQIFKANLRRYLLFFLCSSFTIMVFFTFHSLYTNPDFNDPYQVNGMVSGNLYAPFLVVRVFAVLFIAYAQMAFVKFRKSEFGLLMVLGMRNHNIRKIIIFENGMIALASMFIGLGAGTVFSGVLFFVVSRLVDIGESAFILTFDSYLYTFIFFSLIYIVVIAINVLFTFKYNMMRLLKESRTAAVSLLHGKFAAALGVIFLGIAVYDMLSHYSFTNQIVLLRSIGTSVAGVYFLMSGLGGVIQFLLSRSTRSQHKHLLFNSDLNYSLARSRIVLSLITFLVFITISLNSIIFFITWNAKELVAKNNPYDIAFTEVFGKNSISKKVLSEITEHGATPLVSHQELQYIDLFNFKIFLDKNINALAGTNYHVKQGEFLNLALVAQGEEEKNQRQEMSTYELKLSSGNQTLHSQGLVLSMMFNPVPMLMNGLHIIVNEQDYAALKDEHMDSIGKLQLLNFKDWKKSADIDRELNATLSKYNKDNTKSWYEDDRHDASAFSTKSRIGEYLELQESGRFGIFIFTSVGLLFFIASGVVLHFSILTDLEREKIKFTKLNKIGITSKDVTRIVRKPFKVIFFLPYILGTLLATFYVVCSSRIEMSSVLIPLSSCLLIGGAYLMFQVFFYLLYTKIYIRNMLVYLQLLENELKHHDKVQKMISI